MASEGFDGSDGDALPSGWTAPNHDQDGASNAVVKHANRWTNPVLAYGAPTGVDPDVCELVGLDLTALGASQFTKPACRMTASTSRGYNLTIIENGTNITQITINRHTTSAVASSGTIAEGDPSNVDIAVTAEGTGATVTVRVYIDGTELTAGGIPFSDTDASRITSGTDSGWLSYAAGSSQGTGTEVDLWRDVVGGAAGGADDFHQTLHRILRGETTVYGAGMGGVIEE